MATSLSSAQAAQIIALTEAYKAAENKQAAKVAALVALYYRSRVDVEDPSSIERWLEIVIPQIIRYSDSSADRAAAFFTAARRIEVPTAPPFSPEPVKGVVDDGVRKSLMVVGPYAYTNKAAEIRNLATPPRNAEGLLRQAKETTSKKLAAATIRHAQAGGRQTIYENSARDRVALGYVRVTREKPCAFCALLASRGLRYRAYSEDSFFLSNQQFTGDGDAKVHDSCGCSLKAVYTTEDPLVDRTKVFTDLYDRFGAGGGDALLRFRRGYDHWAETGNYLTFEQANEGLRAA